MDARKPHFSEVTRFLLYDLALDDFHQDSDALHNFYRLGLREHVGVGMSASQKQSVLEKFANLLDELSADTIEDLDNHFEHVKNLLPLAIRRAQILSLPPEDRRKMGGRKSRVDEVSRKLKEAWKRLLNGTFGLSDFSRACQRIENEHARSTVYEVLKKIS